MLIDWDFDSFSFRLKIQLFAVNILFNCHLNFIKGQGARDKKPVRATGFIHWTGNNEKKWQFAWFLTFSVYIIDIKEKWNKIMKKKITQYIKKGSAFKICIGGTLILIAILIAVEIVQSQITGAPLDMDKILNLITIAKKLMWLLT